MEWLPNTHQLNILNSANDNKLVDYIFSQGEGKIINFIYFANFTLFDNNTKYLQAMHSSDIVLLDGIGMQIYFKCLLGKAVENNHGTNLMPLVLQYCFEHAIDVALYGAKEEVIQKCYAKHKQNEQLYYIQNGYTELQWDKIRDNSVLFIGKGSPVQELWQYENLEKIRQKKLIVFGVGGFFDFCSGSSKRAPEILIRLKLEWLYRLIGNPKQHINKNIKNLKIFSYAFKALFTSENALSSQNDY